MSSLIPQFSTKATRPSWHFKYKRFLASFPASTILDKFLESRASYQLKHDRGHIEETLESPLVVMLSGKEAKHAKTSARVSEGDQVNLFDPNTNIEGFGEVLAKCNTNISVSLSSLYTSWSCHPTLILGLPESKTLNVIIEAAIEIGVHDFVLVTADRSQWKPTEKSVARLNKVILAALKQSYSNYCSKIVCISSFVNALDSQPGLRLLLPSPSNLADLGKSQAQTSINNLKSPYSIIIGPEGGFSGSELSLFKDLELPYYSFSDNVLRVETAVLLALGFFNTLNNANKKP